jgi:hypothetical protein
MANLPNYRTYVTRRQHYLVGAERVTGFDSEKVIDAETAVSMAIKNSCPVYRAENVSVIPLYSNYSQGMTNSRGMISSLRDGAQLWKTANSYFRSIGNTSWNGRFSGIIAIPNFGFQAPHALDNFELWVFDNNGHRINTPFNSFAKAMNGVIYVVFSHCSNWQTMIPDENATEEILETVDVVAIRKNKFVPSAIVPTCPDQTEDYNSNCIVNNPNGTSNVPTNLVNNWNDEGDWSKYRDAKAYSVVVRLGTIYADAIVDDVRTQFATKYEGQPLNVSNIIVNSDEISQAIEALCQSTLEVPEGKFNLQPGLNGIVNFERDPSVQNVLGLGLTISVPVEIANQEEGTLKYLFAYTLSSLPMDSRFYLIPRVKEYSNEIHIKYDTKREEYSIESTAFKGGLGLPYFDKVTGALSRIPLGTTLGEPEDTKTNLDNKDNVNEYYQKKNSSIAGAHMYPLATPKAEDVFIFVGNRYGMIKLTPYVDYVICQPGTGVASMTPSIQLTGQARILNVSPNESELNSESETPIALSFPVPEIPPDIEGYNVNVNFDSRYNEDVFISVFVGYPKGIYSRYWGPQGFNPEAFQPVTGYSQRMLNEGNLAIAEQELSNDNNNVLELAWSLVPRDSILQFCAGRYRKMIIEGGADPYLDRVINDNAIKLNVDDTTSVYDIELHSLIDVKDAFLNANGISTFKSSFSSILDALSRIAGISDFKATWYAQCGAKSTSDMQPVAEVGYRDLVFGKLTQGKQIIESINYALWQTVREDVDDERNRIVEEP